MKRSLRAKAKAAEDDEDEARRVRDSVRYQTRLAEEVRTGFHTPRLVDEPEIPAVCLRCGAWVSRRLLDQHRQVCEWRP